MTESHLSASDLAGFLDHDLAPAERRRIEIHLDLCDRCRGELIESRRVMDDYARQASPKPAPRFARRWWIPAAAAAGLAALLLVPRRATVPPAPRDSTRAAPVVDGEGTPRIGIVAPTESTSVRRDDAVLVWHAMTADQYRIAVLSESGDLVWTGETADTTVRVPATSLRSAQAYFWRVDAIANGISATTGVHRLLISP